MKKIYQILSLAALLTLAACSDGSEDKGNTDQASSSADLSDADIMMVLHCAEMKMPECEGFYGIELDQKLLRRGCEVMPEMQVCEGLKQ
ncbi:MAG: hypothetical protein ACI9KN_000373 [Gammaproteobacteria bacterium]|jgi:hypothetical protein